MKLNPDCIRDILLHLEDELTIDLSEKQFETISFSDLKNKLDSVYKEEEIWYSIYNLHEAKYIEGRIEDVANKKMYFCEINNITWNGHQFLNDIRPKTIWDATKDGAQKIGNMSIGALGFIAKELTKKVVTDPLVIASIVGKIVSAG